MALPAAFLSEDQFTCSICLEVFNNPVSTPCGHSFCQSCICSYWDGGGRGAKSYQCPLCKEAFQKRPELHINRTLKEITEQFKQMANSNLSTTEIVMGREPPNAQPYKSLSAPQRPGDMPENIFVEMVARFQQLNPAGMPRGSPMESQSFFLQTQNNGLQDPPPPYSTANSMGSPADVSSNLPPCPTHLRGLEFFCRTDNKCVCSACTETAEHRGHNIVSAKREWQIKKSQAEFTEVELKELISDRERKLEEIQSSLREIKTAAEKETDEAVCAFSKLISSVEHCQGKFLEVIETSLRAAESRAQGLIREVEEEIAALKRKSSVLNQLAQSEDYINFLQKFPTVSTPPQLKDWSGVSVSSMPISGSILRSLGQMVEQLQEETRKLTEICPPPSPAQPVPRPNPKVRRVQEYAEDITLDPSTAHPRLQISPDGKQVRCSDRHQLVADNPERFDRVVCVLAHQGFSSGRHYWEVDVAGKTDWDLGVASRSVNRRGKINVSPAHGYWFLSLRDRTDFAFRTDPSTPLTVGVRPSRIGIYVDCDKGLVSFYNVEAKLLIFSFTDSFPDTVHPFFSPCTNKSGQNEAPLTICPVAIKD
ncbi:zinc finger protein RFP [Nematolebias whitei]|uniref:zinc finger protein RFP n=1 Tax=Nematolebias whitei TaxID=451745 RepID=UPI0018980D2A|nr:zinc finger protein RFP [Nematolebias whitei]